MKTYDLAELAMRNLRESSLRNSLTTVGISVGVASLVAMLSLGIGLQKLATRRLEKSGLFDTVVVTSRRELRGFGREDEQRGTACAAESRALDESARQEIEHLPNVLGAYPDIRFVTELATKTNRISPWCPVFPTRQGRTTHLPECPAASSLRKVRLRPSCKNLSPRSCSAKRRLRERQTISRSNDLAKPLFGQELVMRYAQRVAAPPSPAESAPPKTSLAIDPTQAGSDAAYSVLSREQSLKIVGVSDLDPDSMRGAARAHVFLPLKLAQDLHVMQPSDVRDSMRGSGKQPGVQHAERASGEPRAMFQTVETAVKKMGFNTFSIVDDNLNSIRQFFKVLDAFLGIFGQPGFGGCIIWYRKHARHGDSRTPPRNWNHESHRGK